MKIVKVSSGSSRLARLLIRQTPASSSIWGDCKFVVNSQVDSCDAWFILHHSGLIYGEKTVCDPSQVFYASMEPYERIGNVSQAFLDQFSAVIGTDPKLTGTNVIQKNIHTWWAGINIEHRDNSHCFSPNVNLSYDDLLELPLQESSKLNRICCILSSKNFLDGHHERLVLAEQLANLPIGAYIDFYGFLGEPFLDKLEVQSRYKYSLVFENTILDHYWSEKLADTFLASSFPFYWGCPNINLYFGPGSFSLLNGLSPLFISNALCSAIEGNLYAERSHHIESSKLLVLKSYNVFNEMAELVGSSSNGKRFVHLKPNAYFVETTSQKLRRHLSLFKRHLAAKL